MPEKTTRLFRCRGCYHRMRYGARTCGSCGRPTQLVNRRGFAVLAGLVLLGALALLIV